MGHDRKRGDERRSLRQTKSSSDSKYIGIRSFILTGAPNSNHFGTELRTLGLLRGMREQEALRSAVLQLVPTRAGSRHLRHWRYARKPTSWRTAVSLTDPAYIRSQDFWLVSGATIAVANARRFLPLRLRLRASHMRRRKVDTLAESLRPRERWLQLPR